MWEFCIRIHHRLHCFPIPVLIEKFHIPGIGPVNFPELELAISVLQLVEHVRPNVKDSKLSEELTGIANRFIEQVRTGLPEGVEIKQMDAR